MPLEDRFWAELAEEIERRRRRHAGFVRELPRARPAPAHWTFGGGLLRWHVQLEDVLEPDVDVEITTEVLVVRARPQSAEEEILVGLLAVPEGFDLRHPEIHWESGFLEVRVRRVGGGGP